MYLFAFKKAKEATKDLLEKLSDEEMASINGAGGVIYTYQTVCVQDCFWDEATQTQNCAQSCWQEVSDQMV